MSERWVEFQGGPARGRRDEARVTLNNRGVMYLNKIAYEALGSPAAVKFFYEEDRRCIGMAPQDVGKKNAFPVKQKDKAHTRTINMSSYCKHWGINVGRTRQFEEIDVDSEGMMRLDLNKTIMIGK